MRTIALGADIGGSHITCRLLDTATRAFVGGAKVRRPVNCHASKEAILTAWVEAIAAAADGYELSALQGIGFAMPGPFDYPHGVAWFRGVEKFEALYGVDVRQEILRRLDLPAAFRVRFLNDAACFAIGESLRGPASAHERLLAITLGTGFGTTFIRGHQPVAGLDGVPDDGFLYHIPVGDQIADEVFSTRWFLHAYQALAGKPVAGVKELAALAGSDTLAADVFRIFGRNLGHFLAPWLQRFQASALVIGGNISAAYRLFEPELLAAFAAAGLVIKVYISAHPEDAALCGSAALCDDDFYAQLIHQPNHH
jgi:glucokinase